MQYSRSTRCCALTFLACGQCRFSACRYHPMLTTHTHPRRWYEPIARVDGHPTWLWGGDGTGKIEWAMQQFQSAVRITELGQLCGLRFYDQERLDEHPSRFRTFVTITFFVVAILAAPSLFQFMLGCGCLSRRPCRCVHWIRPITNQCAGAYCA